MTEIIEFLTKILEDVGLKWADTGIDVIIFLFGIIGSIILILWKFGTWLIQKLNELKLNKDLHPFFTPQEVKKATKYFIDTKCQNVAPSIANEPGAVHAFVTNEKLIPFFLKQAFNSRKDDDHRFYMILADSGMGKTTFMINLYLSYIRKNWLSSKKNKIKLLPLGHFHSLDEIDNMSDEEKESTILLLDAFDEDNEAMKDHKKRLTEILDKTWRFREVVITCRTQFFSSAIEEPQKTGILKLGGEKGEHLFYKLYLSPFNDNDIRKYLKKKISIIWYKQRKKAFEIVKKSPNLMVRPMLLNYIEELIAPEKDRINLEISFNFIPFLDFLKLRYKFSLLRTSSVDIEKYNQIYEIYKALIQKWIEREGNRKSEGREEFMRELYEFSRAIALNMYEMQDQRGGYFIDKDEIGVFAEQHNINLEDLEMKSRSLLNRNTEGKYKFSHKSILEYFLAREALEDKEFRKRLNREGLDTLVLFLEEQIESEWLLKNRNRITGDYSILNFDILPDASQTKNLSSITYQEVEKLTYLNIRGRYLPSIYFLDSSIKMKTLTLSQNELRDCEPLEDLTEITHLDLSQNSLEECEVLKNLKNLKNLSLSYNQIKSGEPLKNLSQLELLYLHNNKLKDCRFVEKLTNLKTLSLSQNDISDISPVFGLKKLESLFIPRKGLLKSSLKEIKRNLPNCDITIV